MTKRSKTSYTAAAPGGQQIAAQLFVECLENEGVEFVFGIPGEETLDVTEALAGSSNITFVPVRHEQGAAFMADAYGRLTGKPGVCLATLGPGATNLATGIADATLDNAPMVALTGQVELSGMHKETHQYIDVVEMFKPMTKWNAPVHDPRIIPEAVRKAAGDMKIESYSVTERADGKTHEVEGELGGKKVSLYCTEDGKVTWRAEVIPSKVKLGR